MSVPTDFIAGPDVLVPDLHARTGPEAIRALHGRLSVATAQCATQAEEELRRVLSGGAAVPR